MNRRPIHGAPPGPLRWAGVPALLVTAVTLGACTGPQSALDPAGISASQILQIFWWMLGGAVLVWLVVIGTAVYAMRVRPRAHGEKQVRLLVIGGGIAFPVVVLALLLGFGLNAMPQLLAPGHGLQIHVEGLQWWWRVRYVTPDGLQVDSANEIRLPVGRRVEFRLSSPDVIHSFWIPALGGKMDMIPGRTNRLALEATRVGTFRGVCAEYCGTAHALMAFPVVVMEPDRFDDWLQAQAAPAPGPTDVRAEQGRQLFLNNGCGACHSVRGTPADGQVGPDLTHIGSRSSLGAGTLPNDHDNLVDWIAHTDRIKPEVLMPSYDMLDDAELDAIATWLEGLE